MRRLTRPRRRSAASLVALLVSYGVLTIGAGAAWAAYSAMTVNNSNSFATGDVNSLTNSVNTALLTLSNAKPGDRVSGCIRLTYAGGLPTTVRLYGSTTGTGVDPYLDLKITRGTHSAAPYTTCATFSADSTSHISGQAAGVVYGGTVQNYSDNYDAGLVDPRMSAPESWTSGESHSYKFEITVGDNRTAETKNVTQTFTWEARSSLSYYETVLGDAPVSYWRLGESSGTTAASQMGSNNGTYTGGPALGQPGAISSDSNTAVHVDGVNDVVSGPNLGLTPPFTLEAWASLDGPGSVGSTDYGTILGYGFSRRILAHTSGYIVAQMGEANLTTPAGSFSLGTWHHVVYTNDGTTERIYIDGQERGAQPNSVATWNSAFFMGGFESTPTNYALKGKLDDVAAYSSALSPEQIKSHYVAGRLS